MAVTESATAAPGTASSAAPGTAAAADEEPAGGSPLRMIPMLLLDIGLPTGTYYVLHAFGVSDYLALLAATLVAGVRVVVEALRHRRLDGFAAFLMAVFAVGLVLSFISGDARFLLLKDSIGTSVAGLIFLGTCVAGRPLVYYSAKRMLASRPVAVARLEAMYADSAGFRRAFLVMSLVWGFGLLAEALARIPIVYLLPVSTAVGVSSVLQVVAFALLIGWNILYVRHARAAGRAAAARLAARPGTARPGTATATGTGTGTGEPA